MQLEHIISIPYGLEYMQSGGSENNQSPVLSATNFPEYVRICPSF